MRSISCGLPELSDTDAEFHTRGLQAGTPEARFLDQLDGVYETRGDSRCAVCHPSVTLDVDENTLWRWVQQLTGNGKSLTGRSDKGMTEPAIWFIYQTSS
ncbi:hypothetical protein [Halomonas sp. AOP35-4E-18]|uniref:hypothetical protein n=1 Tax=Halomonas sp. AOP35-4E-18 TaxID=3457686 RepID=UPI0040340643